MKSFFLFLIITIITTNVFSQYKTDIIKVSGECGMCKNCIQKTLKAGGITSAKWDTGLKLLTVIYNPVAITNDEIQKKVAAVGHDTENYKADDAVYSKLPGCCQYERMTVKSSSKN